MIAKQKCTHCATSILQSTADKTNGLCMPCAKKLEWQNKYKEIDNNIDRIAPGIIKRRNQNIMIFAIIFQITLLVLTLIAAHFSYYQEQDHADWTGYGAATLAIIILIYIFYLIAALINSRKTTETKVSH